MALRIQKYHSTHINKPCHFVSEACEVYTTDLEQEQVTVSMEELFNEIEW